ncbi:MAG: amino acid lyase [Acidobacteria bacterium]|nr:amino acid lyase [Acidobacteriota bacterium]
MNRRAFLFSNALAPAAAQTFGLSSSHEATAKPVIFAGDGPRLAPSEYGRVLAELGEKDRDTYCVGGAVEALESRMAALLGKERAMFFPTGTMANHVALRVHAGDRRRVLLQRESHTYNDEGDGPQLLSGLSLVPLASGRATFTLEEVEAEIQHFEGGYRAVPVGAIAIESPVRRRLGETFDFNEMKKISEFARRNQIGLHMDGARLLLAPPYTGRKPAEYAALFDTVYVSLYKYLGAGSGAILAGPRSLIEKLPAIRHTMGGMVFGAWMSAAIALDRLEGFEERFRQAAARSEEFLRLIAKDERVRLERIPAGTNIAKAHLSSGDMEVFEKRLQAAQMLIRKPEKGTRTILLQFNESILHRPAEQQARDFMQALG